MRFFNSFSSILIACLLAVSPTASADIVIHASELQQIWFGASTIRVNYPKQSLEHLSVRSISEPPNSGIHASQSVDSVIVVNRLATYWVTAPHGHGQIRITVPMHLYLTSWDVKALEKELRRLGVKVKPKPLGKPQTKPGPVVSG